MASDRTAAVICNRCAVFRFLPKTWRDLHCNLTAELEEKIHSLEGQTLALGDIRNYEEMAINKRKKSPKIKQKSRLVI